MSRMCLFKTRAGGGYFASILCVSAAVPCYNWSGPGQYVKMKMVYVHKRDFVQDVIRALRLAMMFAKNWRRALMTLVRALGVAATEG